MTVNSEYTNKKIFFLKNKKTNFSITQVYINKDGFISF